MNKKYQFFLFHDQLVIRTREKIINNQLQFRLKFIEPKILSPFVQPIKAAWFPNWESHHLQPISPNSYDDAYLKLTKLPTLKFPRTQKLHVGKKYLYFDTEVRFLGKKILASGETEYEIKYIQSRKPYGKEDTEWVASWLLREFKNIS